MIIQCTIRELPKQPMISISEEDALVYEGEVYEIIRTCKSGKYSEFYVIREEK